jgi:hypothetical protein
MKNSLKTLLVLGFAFGLLFFYTGCKQYKVEMTMNGDGSGTRTVELSMATISEDDFEIGLDEFRALFGLSEKRGWTMRREFKKTEKEEKPDKYIFTLDRKAKSISSWQAMSGDIEVRGTLEKGPLADVSFYNEIEVERSDGGILTYRETLTWNKLKESVIDMTIALFRKNMAQEYPFLSQQELDMLAYFTAGIVSIAWYGEEVAEDQITDEMYETSAAVYIEHIIRKSHPEEDLSGILSVIERTFNDEDETQLDNFLKEKLPGAYLAGHTAVSLTITMPGEIIETNAQHVEGNTATWKYDVTMVAFNHPVEFFVKAKVTK